VGRYVKVGAKRRERKMHSMWHGGPRVEAHSPGWLQNKEMGVVC